MPAIKGSLVKINRETATPGTFATIIGSRNVTVSLGGNEIDTTTADDVDPNGATWSTSIPGVINFTVSVEGLLKDATAYDNLVALRTTGASDNFQVEITGYGTYEGPMVVTSLDTAGPFDDAATYSLQLRASSAPTWTKATV